MNVHPRLRGARAGAAAALAGTAVLTAALLAMPARSATASPVRDTPSAPARVLIDTMTPGTMTPAATLRIEGRVVNTGTRQLSNVQVELLSQRSALTTRSQVASWISTPNDPVSATVRGGVTLAGQLPPGKTARFALAVPARALGLTDASWAFGARGAAVQVLADDGRDRTRVAVQRTFVVWTPKVSFSPTRLTLLTPVTTTTATADAARTTDELLDAMDARGRLDNLVTATSDPAFSWLLDPALLSAAERTATGTGTDGTPTTTATPTTGTVDPPASTGAAPGSATSPAPPGETTPPDATTGPRAAGTTTTTPGSATPIGSATVTASSAQVTTARQWLEKVRTGLTGRDTAALPYADSDVAALAQAGAVGLLRLAEGLSTSITEAVLGRELRTAVALPADGAADATTLQALASTGTRSVVLAADTQPPRQELTYTPSGLSTVAVNGTAPLRGLLYDRTLSAEITATGGSSPALATQNLVADLATLAAEHPNDSRAVLAVTPRGWDPDPAGVATAVRALHAASPWLRLEPLRSLEGTAVPDVVRSAPGYSATLRSRELPVSAVTPVVTALDELDRFAPALTRPEEIVPDLQYTAAGLVGLAWRQHTDGQAQARASLTGRVSALYSGVVVLPGGPKLLVSRSPSPLLVTLENRLDQPVHVVLMLRPRNPRLHVPHSVGVVLDPHRRQTVRVRIRAVANGDVQVETSLLTTDGTMLKVADPITVRVHSDWESRALAITGAVLGLLVLIGLVRGIRRGRTRVPPESVPDADEEVVRRESQTRGHRGRDGPPYGGSDGPPPNGPVSDRFTPDGSAPDGSAGTHPGPTTATATDRPPRSPS